MTPADQNAIETSSLTKRYGETAAIENLDLEISRSTVYGLLGSNGAGKSTTMELLTTLLKPTSGTASVMGTPITERARVKRHIGYPPDRPPLYGEFTAREQLEHVAALQDGPADSAIERIESALDALKRRAARDSGTLEDVFLEVAGEMAASGSNG